MIAAAPAGVGQHLIVDGVGAAGAGVQSAAPAHKGVAGGQVHPLLLAGGQDGVHPILQLVGHGGVFGQVGGLMGHIFLEDLLVAFKNGDLGGSGAGIDGQNTISHMRFLPKCKNKSRP